MLQNLFRTALLAMLMHYANQGSKVTLLSLPAELRMRIWDLAAADDRPTAYEWPIEQQEHDSLGRVVIASTGYPVHVLLQLSRQIRHEALDAVFAANRLMLRCNGISNGTLWRLQRLHGMNCVVRDHGLRLMCIANSGPDKAGQIRWYRDNMHYVRDWGNIRNDKHFGADVYCKFRRCRAEALANMAP